MSKAEYARQGYVPGVVVRQYVHAGSEHFSDATIVEVHDNGALDVKIGKERYGWSVTTCELLTEARFTDPAIERRLGRPDGGVFGAVLKASGCTPIGGAGVLFYECTLSAGPARVILELVGAAVDEGKWPDGTDALMRAIAWQHPALRQEFDYLPWPGKT